MKLGLVGFDDTRETLTRSGNTGLESTSVKHSTNGALLSSIVL